MQTAVESELKTAMLKMCYEFAIMERSQKMGFMKLFVNHFIKMHPQSEMIYVHCDGVGVCASFYFLFYIYDIHYIYM